MYFPDLSPYPYHFSEKIPKQAILCVGWLEQENKFISGQPTKSFEQKLFQLCLNPVNRTRGFHSCDFCSPPEYGGIKVQNNEQETTLGSAEIWVWGENNKVYAAPNLIYHYVTQHHYQPPDEFISAVLNADRGMSQEEVFDLYGIYKIT